MTVTVDCANGTIQFELNDPLLGERAKRLSFYQREDAIVTATSEQYDNVVLAWIDEDPQRRHYFIQRNVLLRPVSSPHWLRAVDVFGGDIEWILLQRLKFRRRQAFSACREVMPLDANNTASTRAVVDYTSRQVVRTLGEFIDDCSSDCITLFLVSDRVLSLTVIVPRLLGMFFAALPSLNVHSEMRGWKVNGRFDYAQMAHFLKEISIDSNALFEMAHLICDRMAYGQLYPLLMQALYCNQSLFPAHFTNAEVVGINHLVRVCRLAGNNRLALTALPPENFFGDSVGAQHTDRTANNNSAALERMMRKRITRALDALHFHNDASREAYMPVLDVPFEPHVACVSCTDGVIYVLSDWPMFALGGVLDDFLFQMNQAINTRYQQFAGSIHERLKPKKSARAKSIAAIRVKRKLP